MSRPAFVPLAAVVLAVAMPLAAEDFYVFVTEDEFDGVCHTMHCSLRDAIYEANATPDHDNIHVTSGRFVLSIEGTGEDLAQTGDLDIHHTVTVIGQGAGVTVIDAQRVDRVFDVHGTGVVFQDLTITGGGHLLQLGQGGGGVRNLDGVVSFTRCAIVDNHVSPLSDLDGGGILSTVTGRLTLRDCIVSSNHAYRGGGISSIDGGCDTVLDRTTISNNSAEYAGGGLFLRGDGELASSTVSGNRAGLDVGGIFNEGQLSIHSSSLLGNAHDQVFSRLPGANVTFANTIVHGRCDGDNANLDTLGGNLESPGDTCFFGLFDVTNAADPTLTPLGRHGGHTLVHLPLPVSPAVDHNLAVANCLSEDQRQLSRPRDGNGDFITVCDIGSVELTFGELITVFMDGFESGASDQW
jgi:CSLREA domain-containing protein